MISCLSESGKRSCVNNDLIIAVIIYVCASPEVVLQLISNILQGRRWGHLQIGPGFAPPCTANPILSAACVGVSVGRRRMCLKRMSVSRNDVTDFFQAGSVQNYYYYQFTLIINEQLYGFFILKRWWLKKDFDHDWIIRHKIVPFHAQDMSVALLMEGLDLPTILLKKCPCFWIIV